MKKEDGFNLRQDEENQLRWMVDKVHKDFAGAYNGAHINTDSLVDEYYDPNANYVTPWGWTEPVDSMKVRIRLAATRMRDYNYRVENLHARSYGEGAYVFFIFRQNYLVGGKQLEEYLPTVWVLEKRDGQWKIVHAHRSTDFETMRQYVSMQRAERGNR
jgi:ketosteroid isomerase-like protein